MFTPMFHAQNKNINILTPVNPLLWINCDNVATVTSDGVTYINGFYNLASTSGFRNVTFSTGDRATLSTSSELNNQKVATFNGSGYAHDDFSGGASPRTLIYIYKSLTEITSSSQIAFMHYGVEDGVTVLIGQKPYTGSEYWGIATKLQTAPPDPIDVTVRTTSFDQASLTNFAAYAYLLDDNDYINLYLNQVEIPLASNESHFSLYPLSNLGHIDTSFVFAEMILFERELTTAELRNLGKQIQTKYKIV